jgi:hypothetical protein
LQLLRQGTCHFSNRRFGTCFPLPCLHCPCVVSDIMAKPSLFPLFADASAHLFDTSSPHLPDCNTLLAPL